MLNPKPHAILLPYPYQGHVTPMFNLSIQLASRGFIVTFVQADYIDHAICKAQPAADSDIFWEARKSGLDIRYTTISDGFPLEFDRVDLNYDQYWETMFLDFPGRLDEVVGTIIGAQESSSFFLVSDTFFSWVATPIAKKYQLVNVSLWTEPALVFSLNYHLDLLAQNGHLNNCGDDILVNYIPGVESICRRDLMSYIHDPDMIPMLTRVVVKGFEQVKEADFILCNTVEELESGTLSALRSKHIPAYAIGPVNFYSHVSVSKSLWSESDCTQWLDSKPPGSVLYISFGSIVQSSKQEIEAFARALVRTKVHFVWVLKSNETGTHNIFPSDQGLIVPWCNQNKVLSSPATGGFLTHCGWNSVLESIWHGVPMICFPFLVDQPTNRKLVVDDWKIGIRLGDGGREVTTEEIARKIDILMRGESSAELKQEMKKVRQKLRVSVSYGGSSLRNLDQFQEDLKTRLKKN